MLISSASSTRRKLLRTTLAAGATALTGARTSAQPTPAINRGATLTVSTFGGEMSDAIHDLVGPEFTKLTGASLTFDIGGQGSRYNKLLAQKGSQTADVFFGNDESIVGGLRNGILMPALRNAISNLSDLQENAVTVKEGLGPDTVPGVPYGSALCPAWNPTLVKAPLASWGDLWHPELLSRLAIVSPVYSLMPAFIILIAELAGGSVDNVDPAFAKLAKLRPSRLTVNWTDWAPLLKTGDIIAAVELDGALDRMKELGYPVDYAYPREGPIAAVDYVAIVRGTKVVPLANAFLNLMIDPTVQEGLAARIYSGPTNRKTRIPTELANSIPYGTKPAKLRFFDPVTSHEKRAEWTERLNTEVVTAW